MNPVSVIMTEPGEDINATPTYLFDHCDLYKTNAREAGLTWFREAKYGLGIHYGLYTLLGQGERALPSGKLSEEDYKGLTKLLQGSKFDAMELVEFAIANGMRYVNFTARTADGFSMFNTAKSEYNCVNTPAGRDFLGELASVCEYHGVGLCLHYAFGADWNHPKGPRQGQSLAVADFEEYKDFVMGQLNELLTQYGPIGAICLEEIGDVQKRPERGMVSCEELYKYVHHIQPQVLVSFNQGLHGSEDFFSCVEAIPAEDAPDDEQGYIFKQAEKTLELRMSLTPGHFGYHAEKGGQHVKPDGVWAKLRDAGRAQANLLVNTALLPDGSLDAEDLKTLLEVGQRIEKNGYPR